MLALMNVFRKKQTFYERMQERQTLARKESVRIMREQNQQNASLVGNTLLQVGMNRTEGELKRKLAQAAAVEKAQQIAENSFKISPSIQGSNVDVTV